MALPEDVKLTPSGAWTTRPRRLMLLGIIAMPLICSAVLGFNLFFRIGPNSGMHTSEWIVVAVVVGSIVDGLLVAFAVRPGLRGCLTAELCGALSWLTGLMVLPGLTLTAIAAVGTTTAGPDVVYVHLMALASAVALVAMSSGACYFFANLKRHLSAARGGYGVASGGYPAA